MLFGEPGTFNVSPEAEGWQGGRGGWGKRAAPASKGLWLARGTETLLKASQM